MKKILTMIFVLCTTFGIVHAQKMISGKVLNDKTGEAIPGAAVVVPGTTIGSVTDIDGIFRIEVPTDATEVEVSFIGMKTVKVPISSEMLVELKEDMVGLDEVVVVGYGTSSKRAVTGSIQKVKSEELNINTSSNAAVALQGRASGVQITQNSGAPGAGVNIKIRGVSSVRSSGNPLIVVDGMPSGISLSDINSNDIESIEILKDASSAAIYGSRAANGVVLVTTKKGKAGEISVNVDYQHGFKNPTDELDIASGSEYMSIMDRAYQNQDPGNPLFAPGTLDLPEYQFSDFDRDIAMRTNTNWFDIVQQDAYYDEVSASLSGGTEKSKYYGSLQYRDEKGLNLGNHYQKANARFNFETEATDWLTLGLKATMTFKFTDNAYASTGNAYTNLLTIFPVYSPSGDGSYFYQWQPNEPDQAGINPLFKQDQTWSDNRNMQNFTTAYAEIEPIKGLKLKTEWGLKYNGYRSRSYKSIIYEPVASIDSEKSGSIRYSRGESYYWNTNNTLTYTKEFDEHRIEALAGYTRDAYTMDNGSFSEEGFPTEYFTLTNANTEGVLNRTSVDIQQYRFISYLGRFKYSFKDRYFAEFQMRRDGSSRFGPQNRWGTFPGGAVSWIMSDENFMDDVNWLEHLKLRVSVGTVGNAEIGNYPYVTSVNNWVSYAGNPGFMFNQIGNKAIHWEKQLQTDIGVDYALWDGLITGSVDYFRKAQNDLIVTDKIGTFHGYQSSSINVNLGDMQTNGIDFSITSNNIRKRNFSWTTDFNISHYETTINDLSPQNPWIESGRNIVVEDKPLGSYFLGIWAGVDPATGHEMIYGVNQSLAARRSATEGDLTGQIFDGNQLPANTFNNNRAVLTDKTPYPDFYGGLNNTLTYKGFELSFLFTYQFGNYIYNQAEQDLMTVGTGKNLSPDLMNGWTESNPTNIPLLWNSAMSGRGTTRFLYDGSYVRLKNVQLAYNLPKNITEKLYMKGLKVYVTAQNLLTFTEYPGQDPEFFNAGSGAGANLSPGIDQLGNYPQMRTFTFGANLKF